MMNQPSAEIVRLISQLYSSRERYVLEMRLGINTHKAHTLQEIAHKLEISRERVRQIQNEALLKLANAELNSMLLFADISPASQGNKETKVKKVKQETDEIPSSKQINHSTEHLVVINFYTPTSGTDPLDGSHFIADRHKVKADWARQDGKETLFIIDGEVIGRWPTESISKITWPSGLNIPTTPKEFASRMEEIKETYPSAYSKWSYEEEQKLTYLFKKGERIKSIASLLGRAPGGIYSRLHKMALIDDSIGFSENLVIASTGKTSTGTVYGLIKDTYQVSISPARSDKVHKRFSDFGWFILRKELFNCPICDKAKILVLRKHWKNMGRIFHRWAITCLECNKTGETRDFDLDFINSMHEQLDTFTPVEEICPECTGA